MRKQVNPLLRLAGDAAGRADLRALENLCREFPANRFLVSVLSRENQHELCVYVRKFSNLMPFGCCWFMNNPSMVEEITRERIEMLGISFISQHSDARVLEQLIRKMEQDTQGAGGYPRRNIPSFVGGWARHHAHRHSAGCYPALSLECRGLDGPAGTRLLFANTIFVAATVLYFETRLPVRGGYS